MAVKQICFGIVPQKIALHKDINCHFNLISIILGMTVRQQFVSAKISMLIQMLQDHFFPVEKLTSGRADLTRTETICFYVFV